MNEITEKNVKRLWVEKDAVCVELKDGRIGRELIRDYEPLKNATRKQLENCRVDCDGVWFDDLDEGLELSGFFRVKKNLVAYDCADKVWRCVMRSFDEYVKMFNLDDEERELLADYEANHQGKPQITKERKKELAAKLKEV